MRTPRKNSTAFRPSLNDICLEDRVVLNGGAGSPAQVAAFAAATNSNTLQTRRDIYRVYHAQLRNAENGAKQILNFEINQIYANGKPSADQFASLQGLINGLADASTFQLSSQLALLPAATDRLVAQLQQGMLADSGRSLVQRLNAIVGTARLNRSADSLKAAINQTISNYAKVADRQLLNYLNTTPINRLSVDSTTGQRIRIQQFMAQQVIAQFGASLGALAKAFPTVANSAIVSNGAISTDPAVQQAFAQQLQSAINTVNFQLASNLSVFNGAQQTLSSQLQQAIFGSGQTGTTGLGTGTGTTGTGTTGTGTTGTGTTGIGTGTTTALSLINALSNVPITSTSDFFPAVNSAFNTTFQNVSGMLGTFFNLPATATGTTTGLPIDIQPTIGGPIFFGFNNGVNNGFGSGFINFGQSPAQQNNFLSTGFANGFSALTTAQNQLFGFNPANFTGFGIGTGTTTTGTGTTTIGTGTTTTGTGTTTTGTGTTTTGTGTTTVGTGTGTTGLGTGTTGTTITVGL